MFGFRLLGIVIVAWGLGSVSLADLPKPSESKPTGEEVEMWIAELDSDVFSIRQQATQKLIAGGGAVVESLLGIAESGSLEANSRALTILESIYTNGDIKSADRAELALEQLKKSKRRSIASRADRVLTRHEDVREKRAVAEIIKLGGIVKYGSLQNARAFAPPNNPRNPRKEISMIVLSRKWKGRDDGLKYIKRLKKTSFISLYRVTGNHVSDNAIKDLQMSMPRLTVQQRGPSYLGISGSSRQKNCYVGMVVPGAAAAKAGIRQGDVVLKFGGKPVPDFETLIELIGGTNPGDTVECDIRRRTVEMKLKVVMGEWNG